MAARLVMNLLFRKETHCHMLPKQFLKSRECSTDAKFKEYELTVEEDFRVLEIYPAKKIVKKKKKWSTTDEQMLPSRYERMPIDQDWKSVWPTARTFQPSVVPLPLHQGYSEKKASPGKNANAELMKIPNFLHLTPPAIKAHCVVLKQFCTKWPEGLETDKNCVKHFPLEIITSDYCHSSPTVRDERARIVTVQFNLDSLNLDYHARDKMIRLVGDRYCHKTGTITLVADRCPLRKQNYDYLMYVLTALYHESVKIEPWESGKSEADMEKFFFEGSRNEAHAVSLLNEIRKKTGQEEFSAEDVKKLDVIKEYGIALSEILNDGENKYTLQQYKGKVAALLGLNATVYETCGESL